MEIAILEVLQFLAVIAVSFVGLQIRLVKSELNLLRCSLMSKDDCVRIHGNLEQSISKNITRTALLEKSVATLERRMDNIGNT